MRPSVLDGEFLWSPPIAGDVLPAFPGRMAAASLRVFLAMVVSSIVAEVLFGAYAAIRLAPESRGLKRATKSSFS